jgi:hypothetical protein
MPQENVYEFHTEMSFTWDNNGEQLRKGTVMPSKIQSQKSHWASGETEKNKFSQDTRQRGQDVKRMLSLVGYRLVGSSAQKAHEHRLMFFIPCFTIQPSVVRNFAL